VINTYKCCCCPPNTNNTLTQLVLRTAKKTQLLMVAVMVCASWRPSVSVKMEQESTFEFKLHPLPEATPSEFAIGDFLVSGGLSTDGFWIVVRPARTDSKQRVMSCTYKFNPQSGEKVNKLNGENGFTGLLYISHPKSGSELQLFGDLKE